jgi:hypothetical protein
MFGKHVNMFNKLKTLKNKFGDLYSAYPSLPSGSRRCEQSVVPIIQANSTRRAHVLLPLALNSKSERRVNALPPM